MRLNFQSNLGIGMVRMLVGTHSLAGKVELGSSISSKLPGTRSDL